MTKYKGWLVAAFVAPCWGVSKQMLWWDFMKKVVASLVLLALSLSGTAHAAEGNDIVKALQTEMSPRSVTGTGYFAGSLRVAATTCSDIRVGQSLASGFKFVGRGNSGKAQFAGSSFSGSIRGNLFRGRGGSATARGEMAAQFSGAGGRISGARVAIVLQAQSGCRVGLNGAFRLR